MSYKVKNPYCLQAARVDKKSLLENLSGKHCTETMWALRVLCEGCHIHNLFPQIGLKLIEVLKIFKHCGLVITRHHNPDKKYWVGTGKPNIINTWSLSQEQIECVQSILKEESYDI
jgi:hypothetical protein